MDSNVEEAAEILLKHNIPSVLVTHHDGEVAGTFSQSDGLNALITVTGIKKKHPICFASGGSVGGRQES